MARYNPDVSKMPPITLDEAKALTHGDILHHRTNRNADGSAQRWRVNGKVKRWKTRPDEIQVPLKYGLRGYGYLDHWDIAGEVYSLSNGLD